jgi:spermidine synthase
VNGELWFAESGGRNHSIQYRIKEKIFSGKSEFQKIEILDTYEYGRMLFLDGVAQSSERDEFIYHETLVHPALLCHPHPEKVCVIGGAEGATLREIFRHPSIKKVVMVDIDEFLVGLCREHLPQYSAGAYDDPRLTLIFGDGRKYLEETSEFFDAIIVDLSDPVPDSPAVYLFTREFYQALAARLKPKGVACLQGESMRPWRVELHARMVNTMAEIFHAVRAYPYFLPCFHELHGHIVATLGEDPKDIDLVSRMKDRGLEFQYFSPDFLAHLFRVPGFVEAAYKEFPEILTDDKPLQMGKYRFGG